MCNDMRYHHKIIRKETNTETTIVKRPSVSDEQLLGNRLYIDYITL